MTEDAAPGIELVYFDDCPHVEAARRRLGEILASLGLPGRWREWNLDDPAAPARLRGLPSPTVLVDGANVMAGVEKGRGPACAPGGAPPAHRIRDALNRAAGSP